MCASNASSIVADRQETLISAKPTGLRSTSTGVDRTARQIAPAMALPTPVLARASTDARQPNDRGLL